MLVHELAHQWFGDDLAIAEWSDLWLSEGHATWYEGHYAEDVFDISWVDRMHAAYEEANQLRADFGPVARPSGNDFLTLFSNNVYDGGGLVLYALYNRVGERDVLRDRAHVGAALQRRVPEHVGLHPPRGQGLARLRASIPFLARWVFGDTVPPMPGHPDWVSPPGDRGGRGDGELERPQPRGGAPAQALNARGAAPAAAPPAPLLEDDEARPRARGGLGVTFARCFADDRARSSSIPCSRSCSPWRRSA